MTPATSSSLVPTSTSNESHTRSVELHARSRYAVQRVSHSFRRAPRSFQIHHPRVSHSCRRASRSFQIRNSRSRSTEDRPTTVTVLSEHHNKDQRKRTQRRSATMFAVFLLCVLRDYLCLTPAMGCAHTDDHRACRVTSVHTLSTTTKED